jgi:DNA-directed RNA polymerase omega subunit
MENNKYLLAIMVAKRAKELSGGVKPLVESKHRKPVMIALEEIKAGKVFIKEKKEPLKAEQIFNEDEKPEDLLNKVEEPEKSEDVSDEVKEPEKPAKVKEIFNEDERSGKPED